MPIVAGGGRYLDPRENAGAHYVEHLRTADLSVGTYSLSAGDTDRQSPHTEDEVYVVTAGRAWFADAGGRVAVGPGDVLFVAARQEHRFSDVTEDFAVVVIFGPAEYSRAES